MPKTNRYLRTKKSTTKSAKMKRILLKIMNMHWLQHLVFWVLSTTAIATYFSISNELFIIDYIYSICFHACLIPLVYIVLRILIPYFLDREKYLFFLVGLVANIFLALGIHELVFNLAVPLVLSEFYIVSFTDINQLILIFGVYSLLVVLLHLSKSYFKFQQLKRDKLEIELSALKNQLNPHFLFNGLNSIYAFSLKGDKRASEAILKLAELLRYVLYEVANEQVALVKELDLIQQYIDLQKMRIKDLDNISFETVGSGSPSIIPMILFPMVENAFKHGNLTEPDSYLKIAVNYNQHSLQFHCENTFHKSEGQEISEGGIGVDSISKILEIAYQNKARLETKSTDRVFETTIKIDFK